MKESVYNNTKLIIFERCMNNEITEAERDELLQLLEEKKEATSMTNDQIKEFFSNLSDMYPDMSDDIEKLYNKINKSGSSDDDDDDSTEEESVEISERCMEILDIIDSI